VPVAEVTEAEFDRVHAVNARGCFFVLQEAARRVRDGGRIVDVSTSTTVHTAAGMGVHAASKAGAKIIVEVLCRRAGAAPRDRELGDAGPDADGVHQRCAGG
jgi:3-oxoacyl-[acyl-carrier protein] reductase